jgi:hypothetical protein
MAGVHDRSRYLRLTIYYLQPWDVLKHESGGRRGPHNNDMSAAASKVVSSSDDDARFKTGLTTTMAPFIEEAQANGETFIRQPYELYSEENQESWRKL